VVAVGVEDGATGVASWRTAAEGAFAEKGLPATGCRLAEGRSRGRLGGNQGYKGEGHDGGEECFHAQL
jgi:hypothetical protein